MRFVFEIPAERTALMRQLDQIARRKVVRRFDVRTGNVLEESPEFPDGLRSVLRVACQRALEEFAAAHNGDLPDVQQQLADMQAARRRFSGQFMPEVVEEE